MVDWNQAGSISAVISALYLPFVLSPMAAAAFYNIGRNLVVWLRPSSALCERLLWEDIPDGLVHDCSAGTNPHSHPVFHDGGEACWRDTLAIVISRGWVSPSRRNRMIRKPAALDLFQEYFVRTPRQF